MTSRIRNTSLLVLLCGLIFFSCSPEKEEEKVVEKKQENLKPVKITDTTWFKNDMDVFGTAPGAAGVFDVPEMLVLSKIDSSNVKQVSEKVVENYAILEKELQAVGAEMNGPIGQITYNNNPQNFVFESILCIKRIPKAEPKQCKIVVLEASRMLVYNFYGSYQNLFAAYDKVKRYCDKNDLLQSGPMREFYITDPAVEKNPEKWLTRIMLPVVSMRKK